MANITSIRSFLKDTQAGLDLLLSQTDEQLKSHERIADLTNMLLNEREAADRLLDGLRECHLKHVTGMGFKAKKAHLEEIIENFETDREYFETDHESELFAKPAYTSSPPIPRLTPAAEEAIAAAAAAAAEEAEAPEVPSLATILGANTEPEEIPRDVRAVSSFDSIESLGIPHNAVKALLGEGLVNVGQVTDQTPEYLLTLPNFGPAALQSLLAAFYDGAVTWEAADELGISSFSSKKELEEALDIKELNKKQARAYSKGWYRKNKERIRASQRRSRQRNKIQRKGGQ
tara:strand:+ start:910 stop:1776 length:867 start_codon:yes stop_codon:yes gene_type:complete